MRHLGHASLASQIALSDSSTGWSDCRQSKRGFELLNAVDTLQRATSLTLKEITKNPALITGENRHLQHQQRRDGCHGSDGFHIRLGCLQIQVGGAEPATKQR